MSKPHKRPTSYFNLGWNDAKSLKPFTPPLGTENQMKWYHDGWYAFNRTTSRRITT